MLRVVDDHTDLNEVLDVAYDRNEISVIKLSNYGIKMHGFFLTSDVKEETETCIMIALETKDN
jgi:peptide methionine sulfoxide reductase MsrA